MGEIHRWLFLGPEHGLKRQEIQRITEEIKSQIQPEEEVEHLKLFVGDIDSDSIKNEIQTASIFSSIRFIMVYQIELLSSADAKIIATALEHQDRNTFVFLISDETRIHASIDKLFSSSQKKTFWSLNEEDYKNYVIRVAEQLQLQLADDAIELIVFLFGESSVQLDTVLKQIQVFMLSKKDSNIGSLISRGDIELWLSHFKHESIFHVFEYISNQEYEKAHIVLNSLLQSGEHPVQLMAGLIFQMKNALKLKQEMTRGAPKREVFNGMNIRSYSIQTQYLDFVSNCSLHELQTIIACCYDTEVELRSGGDSKYHNILITKLLHHICMLHSSRAYILDTATLTSHYNRSNTYLHEW